MAEEYEMIQLAGHPTASTPTTSDIVLDLNQSAEHTDIAEQRTQVKQDEGASNSGDGECSGRECVTCCTVYKHKEFPCIPHQGSRTHGEDICTKCWRKYLSLEVMSKAWDKICCPQCEEKVEEPQVKLLATTTSYHE